MKAKYLIICMLCAVFTMMAAEANFEYLTAKSDGRVVVVEWRPSVEKGVLRYEVERSSSDQGWRSVASQDSRGPMYTYKFVDEDALMRGDKQAITRTVYSYRLKVIGNDYSVTYTNPVNVAHSVSGIRRTWGMIKEMFR